MKKFVKMFMSFTLILGILVSFSATVEAGGILQNFPQSISMSETQIKMFFDDATADYNKLVYNLLNVNNQISNLNSMTKNEFPIVQGYLIEYKDGSTVNTPIYFEYNKDWINKELAKATAQKTVILASFPKVESEMKNLLERYKKVVTYKKAYDKLDKKYLACLLSNPFIDKKSIRRPQVKILVKSPTKTPYKAGSTIIIHK